jgi:hypothetical protein
MQEHPDASARSSTGTAWPILLLVAASAFAPLMILANANETPSLLTFAFTVGVVTLVSMGLWLLARNLGLDHVGSAYAIAIFILITMNAGDLIRSDGVDRLYVLAGAAVAGALAYRLRRYSLLRSLMTWAALFFLAYPMTLIVAKAVQSPIVTVDVSSDLAVSPLGAKPDVLVVVLDAYGGADVLADYYGFDNTPTLNVLQARGFEAPRGILANYGRTQLSIPTVLQLDYVTDVADLTDHDIKALLGVLGGDNKLATALKTQGYRTVQVESGWLGSRCSRVVDICVTSPWPDETFYDSVYRSALVGLPGFELGRPFTIGALHASEWLRNEMPAYLGDDRPDFIFAHVLLPHPPLFLSSECVPDWRGGADGFAIGRMGYGVEETAAARALYVQQVECANRLMMEVSDMLDDQDVVVFMGDHGPDSQAQMFMQSEDWSEDQRNERFETFLAARVPGCDMSGIESLVNVGRRMLSCLSGDPFPDLPTRIFDIYKTAAGNSVVELEIPSRLLFEVTG